jgi:hypothetical protein
MGVRSHAIATAALGIIEWLVGDECLALGDAGLVEAHTLRRT